MMNKRQIVLDFSVFILFDVEELCSYVVHFFGQVEDQKNNPFNYKLTNYENFLLGSIDPDDIIENESFISEMRSMTDFLTNSELNNLREYLNNNFTDGYPDGDGYGNGTPLQFTNGDLIKSFSSYLKYRELNKDVFITYYIQLFDTLRYSISKELKEQIGKIQNIKKTKDLLDLNLSKEFIENERLKYREKLFRSVKKNNFQYKGLADEKGLYFKEDETIESYLMYLKNNSIENFDYPAKLPLVEKSLNYLVYKYYLYVLDGKQLDFSDHNIQMLQKELDEYKIKNKGLLDYISGKGFTNLEIDSFINSIQDDIYSDLNLRSISGLKQVQLFHFMYSFFVFDYFNEKENTDFSSESDFIKILDLQKIVGNEKNGCNQFYKYYANLSSNSDNRHYPFTSISKTVVKIVNNLDVEEGKLKPIPK